MIHEHEATQLASAAIDFGLPPDVEAELAEELRECPVCAERAAGYREQVHLMQRLPVIDASDSTRRKVTAAAMGRTTAGRSPMTLLLAAALLLALLLALTAAAGALLRNRQPLDLLADGPSPSAGASPASGSPAPANEPPAGGVFPDRLEAGSLAEVIETNVRVRSQPRVAADSTRLSPFLQPGDRLYVVGGPVVADNYDWYQVVPFGRNGTRSGSQLPTGWVSRGDHDARPWIKPVEPACPAAPVDVAQLTSMHRLERLACFGNAKLSFQAIVDGRSEAGWTATTSVGTDTVAQQAAGTVLAIKPSASGAPAWPSGRATLLTGAFDDPSCVPPGPTTPFALLDCRAMFVVTDARADEAALGSGDSAVTVSDGVRVRSLPLVDDSSAKLELLPIGTRLGVVGGPAVGSGYVWYQVAVPSIRTAAGGPRTGWVAAHSKDGEPWVGGDDLGCPPADAVTLRDLARLTSTPVFNGGVVCYGRDAAIPGAEITLSAYLGRDCEASATAFSSWLDDPRRTVVLNDGTDEVRAVLAEDVAPALDCGGAARRTRFDATGHFDDQAAAECRSDGVEAVAAVYECRSRFVITDLQTGGPRAP
jgi:hypothetical protein